MRKSNGQLQLSATDLSNYIACHHLSFLELSALEGLLERPEYRDPLLAILQERGQAFEADYLAQLKADGFQVEDEFESGNDSGFARTTRSMLQGQDYIYQATLDDGTWNGRADFLKKVDRPSKLGNWSYEVMDSKLAKETRAETILQLCLYSQLIGKIQGVMPEFMYVITPDEEAPLQTYRVDDFMAYHRLVQKQLLQMIATGTTSKETYPHPTPHCNICNWWHHCDSHRRADDHLSLVAGLSNGQRTELARQNILTLAGLGEQALPAGFKPSRGSAATFLRLREQARVQLEARNTKAPVYELLDIEEGIGLSRLPLPSPGDLFFDLESDPFAGKGGMEYLFGWQLASESEQDYHAIWALDAQAEKEAFETFIGTVGTLLEGFPDMHIYHYSPYEPVALKRLMGKYNCCEKELDELLRGGVFIDLHSVTKQALRAGIEAYSLKELEVFHAFERQMELRQASLNLRNMERFLERNQTDDIPEEVFAAVAQYNLEDCLSTRRLRGWLEDLRSGFITNGTDISRPEPRSGEASEALSEHQLMILELYRQLMNGISLNREERDPLQQGLWLLANMLDWHRRENKSKWWEYFRLCEMPDHEMLDEKVALAGLEFTGTRETVKRSFVDEYRMPLQDSDLAPGDSLKTGDGESFGEVVAIDLELGLVSIKKGPKIEAIHPYAVFNFDFITDENKPPAIIRLANWVLANGIDHPGPEYRAARDLLLGLPPRTSTVFPETANAQEKAIVWANHLSHGVLAIQGPPGAGKSHTAALMILELIAAGKQVGITALSHKVIRGLLDKVLEMAEQKGITLNCIQKVSAPGEFTKVGLTETKDNGAVVAALRSGTAQIAAGTSWLWSREDMEATVDVLVIDEAGQFSLVDTLAIAESADSLVLLGDPQQLKQPLQGSHPEGTEVSALEHILQGHQTIPADKGVFLDETWRLHPSICAFVSELFYDSRLNSRPGLEQQMLTGHPKFSGSGLWFVPVTHDGNQSNSPEEAATVGAIVNELLQGQVMFNDNQGKIRQLTNADIKVIAPYNAQVDAINKTLNGIAVGTVDKFQGQEAPVVIFSMATSNPEDAPRGMDFLYSANRLNVAVSRAKAVFILVASPKLFEPDCRNPEQMKLANAFCRYLEMAH
ncbi:TM0106 family RecB-like putative nuclease [Mucilaginibacter sp. UYCu711]|uniref:TM0106 family RecB-like putative nuclease n=1 Tax=Mucilaginibacter sp. UYCu711 TaxID=3156339 RepID=UPI003D1CE933